MIKYVIKQTGPSIFNALTGYSVDFSYAGYFMLTFPMSIVWCVLFLCRLSDADFFDVRIRHSSLSIQSANKYTPTLDSRLLAFEVGSRIWQSNQQTNILWISTLDYWHRRSIVSTINQQPIIRTLTSYPRLLHAKKFKVT